MKGIEKEYLVGLLIVMIVFIVALLVFLGVWKPFDKSISQDQLYSDCSKWLSTSPSCQVSDDPDHPEKTLENYPALKKTYGDKAAGIAAAKLFCNCP